MLELHHGDILAADAEALVNPVNCVGVMGAGLALQFRHAFPQNFAAYQSACAAGQMQPRTMLIHATEALSGPRWIVNFPTKRHWREDSQLEDVEAGLLALANEVKRRGIRSIAVPALGCGLGGLKWADVRPRIEGAFATQPEVRLLLFEPAAAPATFP